MQKTHAFGRKSTEKTQYSLGTNFLKGTQNLTERNKTPTAGEPRQESPPGRVSVAFTSGMVTGSKVGLRCLTTDVRSDKLSVQEIKSYSGVSMRHTRTHTHSLTWGSQRSLVFGTFTLDFLF